MVAETKAEAVAGVPAVTATSISNRHIPSNSRK
jgi:hypothetical protein